MEYPIIVDGRATGRLTVTPAGLVTVFEAQCEDTGKVLRLSVYGENEGYLGVMTPREGKLYLKKNLSRASMRGFPKQITHAGPAGEKPEQVKREEAENSPSPNREPVTNPAVDAGGAAAEANREGGGEKMLNAPQHGQEPGTDLLWYRTPDGTLFTKWEGRSFMAVPEAVRGLPMEKCLEHRPIEGQVYAVFETKNGRII
jgi:hypothetical protein